MPGEDLMPRFAANISLLFAEHPFLDRFDAAAAAGFRGVECLFPYAFCAPEIAGRLQDLGIEQVLFNLPAGDWEAGERGLAALPGRQDEFRRGVELALSYAERLDCPRLNCLAGIPPSGDVREACWDTLLANLAWAADQLALHGRTLTVEAINSRLDMPGFFLNRSEKVVRALEQINRRNACLQFDLYHQQVESGDVIRTYQRLQHWIGHIQFADNPGRHEPGTGELAFDRIFQVIDESGYAGWVSAEYRPRQNTTESLAGWFGTGSGSLTAL